jgi:hypothetical protein
VTLREFADMFALLAVQLRQTDADEAVIRGYYEGLQDLEPELLKAAADRLARAAEWFPKTSDWRTTAEAIRRERIDAQRAHLRRASQPVCCICNDAGWQPIDVVENGRSVRRVTPCACRAQRQHELLGHVPLPALPPAAEAPDSTAFEKLRTMVAFARMPMPRARRSSVVTSDFEKAAETDPVLAAELFRRKRRAQFAGGEGA